MQDLKKENVNTDANTNYKTDTKSISSVLMFAMFSYSPLLLVPNRFSSRGGER